MELFTYLMAKNDHNTSVKKDLFSYLLGKNQSGTYQEFTGTSISANNTKKGKMKVNLLGNTSQKTTTGKNLLNIPSNYSVTGYIERTTNIPAGDYVLSAKSRTASVQNSTSLIMLYEGKTKVGQKYLGGYSPLVQDITLTGNANRILIYSNGSYNESVDKTTTFEELMISSNGGDYEEYSGGIPSPNPDYPQVIHTITGDNTIKVEGKNLAIKNIKGFFNAGADKIAIDGDSESFVFYAVEGQTYTYNSQIATNRGVVAKVETLDIVNNTPITYSKGLNGQKTFTSEFTGYCILYVNSSKNEAIKDTFIVNKGNTALPYEPYTSTSYPIHLGDKELCKISTYQDRFIRTTGKNLLNIDNWVKGRINNTTGNIEYANNVSSMTIGADNISFIVSQAWNSGITSEFIPISTGDYVFKYGHNREITMCIDTYDNQKTRIARIDAFTQTQTPTTRTFTIDNSDIKYIRIHFEVNTANVEYIVSEMQLEKGTTATSYEPYGTNEWYLEKKITKQLVTSSSGSIEANGFRNDGNFSSAYKPATAYPVLYTKYFTYGDTYNSSVNTSGTTLNKLGLNASGQVLCNISGYTTTTQYVDFFNNNDVYLYYPLLTPTYTQITGTLKDELEAVWRANSYKGQTNISQINNDLPFNLDVEIKVGS